MDLQKEQVWQLALIYVRSNNVFIRYVASRYSPFMSCSSEDIEAEALLSAFHVICNLLHSGKDLDHTESHFKVIFTQRCIQLAKGPSIVKCNPEEINIACENRRRSEVYQEELVRDALSVLTGRQRLVAEWTLSQPMPATPRVIANHFGVTVRGVRKIINNAVRRLENNGHQRICKSVTVAS